MRQTGPGPRLWRRAGVSGAGKLALAAWLEPFPLPFPPRRAFLVLCVVHPGECSSDLGGKPPARWCGRGALLGPELWPGVLAPCVPAR